MGMTIEEFEEYAKSHNILTITKDFYEARLKADMVEAEEEQEPTTKNDLGVDAVSRQAVIDLMMQKWGENFSGDDAMQESMDAIRVMPSVTPQEPILDKVRAEIEQARYGLVNDGLDIALNIIDKYKAESEPQESEDKG